MFPSSCPDIFSVHCERDQDEEIRPSDQVQCGENLYPYFEVIAVDGYEAWLRNVNDGTDHLALLSRCRRSRPGRG